MDGLCLWCGWTLQTRRLVPVVQGGKWACSALKGPQKERAEMGPNRSMSTRVMHWYQEVAQSKRLKPHYATCSTRL